MMYDLTYGAKKYSHLALLSIMPNLFDVVTFAPLEGANPMPFKNTLMRP